MYPRRLAKEFQKASERSSHEIFKKNRVHYSLDKPEDLYNWKIVIQGPIGTPYEDGVFILTCEFPKEYPFKPPNLKFVTKILHINCDENGRICIPILHDFWSPALNLMAVFRMLLELMKTPQPNDCINSELLQIYKEDINEYNQLVRDFTLCQCPNI